MTEKEKEAYEKERIESRIETMTKRINESDLERIKTEWNGFKREIEYIINKTKL